MSRRRLSGLCLLLGCLTAAGWTPLAVAQVEEESQPAPPAEPPANAAPAVVETPGPPSTVLSSHVRALDEAAAVVLRTGCLGGIEELRRALAATASDEDRRFGARLLALCQGVLAAGPNKLVSPSLAKPRRDNSGRAKLAIAMTLYGAWTGISTDVILELDDARSMVLPPLLGVAAGLGGTLWLTSGHAVTSGEAWTTITGFQFGAVSGFLLAGALDMDSGQDAWTTSLVTGLAGGGIGIAAAMNVSPSAGDAEMVRSGGLYGLATAGLGLAIVQPDSTSAAGVFGTLLVGMNGGLLTGVLLARRTEYSRNRMLLIDAGTIAGAVAGLGLSVLVVGTPDDGDQGRAVAGATLAGLYGGMLAAIVLTERMEDEDDAEGSDGALVVREPDGRWHLGGLALQPAFSQTARGLRPTGVLVPLLGGAL